MAATLQAGNLRSRVLRVLGILLTALTFTTVLPDGAHAYNWRAMSSADSARHAFGSNVGTHFARRGIDPRLDHSTDGCSLQAVTYFSPWLQRFYDACVRHDFGYRNFGKKRLWASDGVRKWVDDHFYADMMNACSPLTWVLRVNCQGHAGAFYTAVRIGGHRAFWG